MVVGAMNDPDPGGGTSGGSRPGARPVLAALGVLLLLATLLVQRIGAADVCTGIEAVEALVVQRIASHDEWLFPRQNSGQPTFKPPLFHWSAVLLQRALGFPGTTGASVRLASAAWALAAAIAAMWLARRALDADAAVLAGLALAATTPFVGEGRFGRVDMALACWETLALAAFVGWLGARGTDDGAPSDGGTRRAGAAWLYLLALSMGAAVLTKGPVGALVPGAAIVAFLMLERRPLDVLALLRPGPVVFGALLASAFYLACWWSGRLEFLQRQVEWENLRRFSGDLGTMKPWYYVVPILFGAAPISLFVPWAVGLALVGRLPAGDGAASAGGRGVLRLLAVFWLVTVVFFSAAAYKRRAYLLPVWPAAAVLLAAWVRSVDVRWRGLDARRAFLAACGVLVLVNLFWLPWKERRECRGGSQRAIADGLRSTLAPDEPIHLQGLDEEVFAPLLFYLGREAPLNETGTLAGAPPGAILLTREAWAAARLHDPGWVEVASFDQGPAKLVLVRRGE